jgi:hypothetical protein
MSPDVVPYQNSPFFVSAIDAAPFFKLSFPAGSPRLSVFCLETWRIVVKGAGRGGRLEPGAWSLAPGRIGDQQMCSESRHSLRAKERPH